MLVTKVRGQNKVGKIIMSRAEFEIAKKFGLSIDDYIKQQLKKIAKQRKWKWYFEEKNHAE